MDDELRLPPVRRVISAFSPRQWIVLDVAVALLVAVPVIVQVPSRATLQPSGTGWDVVRYSAIGLAALAIPFRRRHPVGVLTLGVMLVLPAVFAAVPASIRDSVDKFLPGSSGQAIFRTIKDTATLSPWVGLAVFSLYAVGTLAVSLVLVHRRDA